MQRFIIIVLLVVGFCIGTTAQNEDFEIKVANQAKKTFLPGVTTNLAIRLVNNFMDVNQVSLRLKLPKGWRCFSDLSYIQIPINQSIIKILSLNIPSYTFAGNYLIYVEAFDLNGKKISEMQLPLTIEPKYVLQVDLVKGPDYVFAGDTISVQFMIKNLSTSKVKITSILKWSQIEDSKNFTLNPDSFIMISRKIKTENNVLNAKQDNVSLTASIDGMPDVSATNYSFYNLIPRQTIKSDPFNRILIDFSTLFVTDNPWGKRESAFIFDVNGKGFIDDQKKKKISFHFQGPDRVGQPLYGIYEEYFVEYSSPKSKYLVGDNNYWLSYLTEFTRYGRGGKIDHTFNHITIGSFINFPRFFPNIKREISFYSGFSLPNKISLNLGYLNKINNNNEVNHLMTFNGFAFPFKWADFNWEYALGTYSGEYKQAYKAEMNLNLTWLRLFYNFTMADKNFPGYFTDTRFMTAFGVISLSQKVNIEASYNYFHQNIALDTIYGSAPFSKNLYLMINYGFLKDSRLSLSYTNRDMQDHAKPMQFNYNTHSIRLNFYTRIKNLGFNLIAESGYMENLLMPINQRLNSLYLGQLNVNYKVSRKLNINGFVTYQESKSYNIRDYKNWIYNLSVNGSISKKLNLLLNYQSSYDIEEYYHNRSILNGQLNYTLNQSNRFEISSRYYLTKNSLNVKELAFMARYVHTFQLPISKRKNLGKLSGRVLNNGVKTIEGIVLSMGSEQTITDKNGNYSFPRLPPGTYYLMIDYSKAGIFAVPETPGPYQIEIFPGRESRFDIGLTTSAKIIGEVSIQKEVSDQDKTYAGIRDRLGKLLVEAKNGSEVYRIFTKETGEFAFESLRPGPWTVRIYQAGIPKEYELVTDQFNVGLASGQSEHIEVKVKEVRRRIKFQKSIETTPDYETTKPPVPGSKKTDSSNKIIKPVKTAKTSVKTPEKITRMDTSQVKKQIKVVSVRGNEAKSTSENIEYRIQLRASVRPLASTDALAAKLNITEKIREDLYNGRYIYTIGTFKSQREAATRNKEIQKNADTSDSFIVSFRDGARIPNTEKLQFADKLVKN